MQLKIIKTPKDYPQSLERFEEIFQAQQGSPENDEADLLAQSIKAYEDAHFIIDAPDLKNSDKTD